jgi:hypothetical protein
LRSVTSAAEPEDNQEHAAEAKHSSVQTQDDVAIFSSSRRVEQVLTRAVAAGDARPGYEPGSISMAIELGTLEKLGQFAARGLGLGADLLAPLEVRATFSELGTDFPPELLDPSEFIDALATVVTHAGELRALADELDTIAASPVGTPFVIFGPMPTPTTPGS